MKLLRYGEPGKEKPGVWMNDEIVDVSSFVEDFNDRFFDSDGLNKLSLWLNDNHDKLANVSADVRIESPVARLAKIICVGLNYSDHAREADAQIPDEPILFLTSTTARMKRSVQMPFRPTVIRPSKVRSTGWGLCVKRHFCFFAFPKRRKEAYRQRVPKTEKPCIMNKNAEGFYNI